MRARYLALACFLLIGISARAADAPALSEGITLVAAGECDAAAVLLQPLAAANPEDSVAQYWLGRAYYGQRHYLLASAALAVAADRDPQNREACLWYARALRMAGRAEDAVAAYRAYQIARPNDSSILVEYAAARAQAGDFRGARETFSLLLGRDPSPATRKLVAEWTAALEGISRRRQLEPSASRKTAAFELVYEPEETRTSQVLAEVERARTEIGAALGFQITGFRVLLFPTWASYARYARIILPSAGEISAAFTLPGALTLWSPGDWPVRGKDPEDFSRVVRHEMTHLAISQRTNSQGVPLWLNEGLACHYGGWAGRQDGRIPEKPLSPRELDLALMNGDLDRQERAYAQARAMARVLAHRLGGAGVVRLLDELAMGIPLQTAYQHLAGEPLETLLAEWPRRLAELTQTAE